MPVVSGDTGTASAGTLNELIESVRQAAGDHPTRDTLGAAIADATVTSITFSSGTAIPPDALIEVELEVMRVLTKPSTSTATVARGQYATPAVSHLNGTEVITGFRNSRFEVKRAINRTLNAISLAMGKSQWATDKAFSTSGLLIEAPASARRVTTVAYKPSGSTELESIPFRWRPSMPTSVIASGKAVELTAWNPGSGTAYIEYWTPWTNLDALDDVLDEDYPADAVSLIEMGAMAYLENAEEFERVAFTQSHALRPGILVTPSEVRIAAQSKLLQFLQMRSDFAAVYGPQENLAWVRG